MTDRFTTTLAVRFTLALVALILILCTLPVVRMLTQQQPGINLEPFHWLQLISSVLGFVLCIIAMFVVPSPSDQIYKDAVAKYQAATDLRSKAEGDMQKALMNEQSSIQQRALNEGEKSRLEAERGQLKRDLADLDKRSREFEKQREQVGSQELKLKAEATRLEELRNQLNQQAQKLADDQRFAQNARQVAQEEADVIRNSVQSIREECERQQEEAMNRLQAAKTIEDRLSERQADLDQLAKQLSEKEGALNEQTKALEHVAAQASLDKKTAQENRDQASQLKAEALQIQTTTHAIRKKIDAFRTRFWPEWLANSALEPSLSTLEQRAIEGSSNAAMILAYLQLFQTIETHSDYHREFNYLWPTVREIGRFLAAHLAELEVDANTSAEHMLAWSKVLNQCSKGRFTVTVPSIGAAFNSAQMDSKAGQIAIVSRVMNWAISKANSIIASKAEVS